VHNGFQLDSKLIRFAAKKLSLPRLVYKQKAADDTTDSVPEINEQRASWNLQDVAFTNPGALNNLHVFSMYNHYKPLQGSTVVNIRRDFVRQLKAHRVVATAGYVGPQERGDDELEAELEHWFSLCQKDDCTVVLLSKKNFDIYAKIKRVGDFLGHHTICAIENKIKDGKPNEIGGFCWQHFSNMALKVNLKLGGDNHWLNDDDLNEVLVGELRSNTMILGSDVTHPGHGAKIGYPSIACVVGTVDAKFMSYRGSMRLQAGGQEQIDEANLCSMIMERLETWKSNNNERLPTTILFYRDGVSESQFAAVEKLEIPQIKEAYKKAGGKPDQLRVCFLVVSKRHHTRFYAADKETSYKSKGKINGNVKAGLLVDDIVTAPKPTKFFLQSHCAIKGTARSAHYYVLRNDTNISEANLKQLTMMLCYTFGRSTTGVSYATPAYVADRLCDRGRSYIRLWAENEYAKPVFTYKKYYGADGTERKATDKEILDEKNAMVKKFLHSPVWGDNYEDDPNMPQRLNPWHPNLDDGMFWM
jgi:eukaryotic translation initiation factor 2C